MSLSNRKKMILKSIIEQHVDTAEPVGSKAVAAVLGSSVSSATVRNEMMELESLMLLEQPHTSAGRVPTAKGYRVYVNEIMGRHMLSKDDEHEISSWLTESVRQSENAVNSAGNLTSRITSYPAYATTAISGIITIARFDFLQVDAYTIIIVTLLSNDTVKNKLVHFSSPISPSFLTKIITVFNASFTNLSEERITTTLIESTERALGDRDGVVAVVAAYAIEVLCEEKIGKTHIAGTTNLLSHPEYRDVEKARRVIDYLSDNQELAKLPSPGAAGEVIVSIGVENLAAELQDASVITIRYDIAGDLQGILGVVGPTRMDYSKVAATLAYIASGLNRLLSGSESGFNYPPGVVKGDDIFGQK